LIDDLIEAKRSQKVCIENTRRGEKGGEKMVTARLQLEQLVYYVFAVSTRSQRSQRNWLMQEYCDRLYVPEMGGDAAKSFPVIYVSRESWEESTTNRYFVLTLQASPFVTKLAQVRLFNPNLLVKAH